jgi:hypothetical protein
MGYFNSHSTLWGCSYTNQKGLEIEKFLMQSNLCLLNNKSATYLHPGTGTWSSLDYALFELHLVSTDGFVWKRLLNLLLKQLMTVNVGGSLELIEIRSETFAAAS